MIQVIQVIHLEQCQYTFPSGRVVGPLDLQVAAGELVVLAGETGAGKSTVARMVVGLSQRHGHGRVEGTVLLGGLDPGGLSGAARVRAVGFVGQEVDDCVLSGSCAGEVAFALESVGLPQSAVAGALELDELLVLDPHAARASATTPIAGAANQRARRRRPAPLRQLLSG